MTNTVRLLGALFIRDFRIASSYRVGFLLSGVGALGSIVGIFFLSRAFGDRASQLIDSYGGNYFSFVLIGVAFTNFMALGIGGLAGRIREGLTMGTLDFMLASPNRLAVLLFGSSLWSHAFGAVTLAVYLIVGAWLGMDLTSANVPLTLLAFVLAVVSFNALGLIAASGVILIKQGDPVTWVISTASLLLAGIFYPTSVLPAWLQAVAQLLPLTHALEVVRRAGLANEGLSTLWPSLAALAALTAALLTLGLVACHFAVRIARTDGSLSYY